MNVRAVLTTAGVLVGVWVLLVVLAWGFQRHLIYLPDRAPPVGVPSDVEEVTLTTADDLRLAAWYLSAATDPSATEPSSDGPASVVMVTPGNAGNRELRLPLARGLAARGHDVLLVEYRGYGGNPGRPSEEGLVQDARAAWDHLLAREEIDDDRIVVLGESIGTGVAAGLAAQLGPRDGPAALVLRSPFPALAEVARRHYPFLPVRLLLTERFPVSTDLAGLDTPVLVVAGGADTIVPTARSREVAEAAGARYVELPGVDHNDAALLDGDDYLDAVDSFVRDVIAGSG